jgi:Xaa-Pro aminopeptidase
MRRRRERLQQELAARSIDAALLHTADNVYYISGVPLLSAWGRPMWTAISQDERATVIGAMLEYENMEAHSWIQDIRAYDDSDNVWSSSLRMAAGFLESVAARRVGVERSLLTVGVLEALQEALPHAAFVEIGQVLADLRVVKSPEEIRLLTIGAEIAKIGASAFLEAVSEHATELAVASHAVREMDRTLAALLPDALTSTYAYCQVGDHTMTPHLHPTGRRIHRGDVIGLNVFPVVSGYCMELERTFVFGNPTDSQRQALDATNAAFEAAKAAIRPGARMADIDHLTREILNGRGYGAYIRHGTGHAHGIMIGASGREEPGELRTYNTNLLRPNMVTSVEPGIYVPGVGGFRHSDVMLVTETGATCLTEFPRDL